MKERVMASLLEQSRIIRLVRRALLRSASSDHTEGIIIGVYACDGSTKLFFVFLSIYGEEAAFRLYCRVLNRLAPVDFELHEYKCDAYISSYKAHDGPMLSIAKSFGEVLLLSKGKSKIYVRNTI